MLLRTALFLFVTSILLAASSVRAEEKGVGVSGTIITFWPFVDYRESPDEQFSNLSILGPLVKIQRRGGDELLAIRPFVYREESRPSGAVVTDYLYPVASTEDSPDATTTQVLKLFQKTTYRKDEPDNVEKGTMFFPFYISGSSKKYGPYTSVFPFYGDIYERFWRDEYHYVLFPLYGRTVKGGTTTRNYLYPFFSTVEGERETGFQFWPLYGQSSREGVYRKRFVLWPIFMAEETGLDTDNPTRRLQVLPFYVSSDSPKLTTRYYLWPLFGYSEDLKRGVSERYYLWPLVMTARGEERSVNRFLPFYADERGKETFKRWYLWPLYRHDGIRSETFVQERDRILFFLYSDNRESWPVDGAERRRMALWPLFVYQQSERRVRSVTFPAPIEPILNSEGIERNWAPFWRIYIQRWNDAGHSAVSFLWNLYWHERRNDDLALELFPLLAYRSDKGSAEVALLKGLVRYRDDSGRRTLYLFWLPFGIDVGTLDDPKNGPFADATRFEP